MSRKFACILLAATVLLSSLAIVYADETAADTTTYLQAVETLSGEGMTVSSASAITDGRGLALAAELGMLSGEGTLSISELSAQALVLQQQQQLQAEEEALREAERQAYLALYDGVMVSAQSAAIYDAPSTEGTVLRTLGSGKVAKLLDVAGEWYHVSFGKTTGYIAAGACRGVHYADYEGTLAAMDLTEAIIDYAYTYLGTPYVYGGSSYSGTDCSGFTMRVFAQYGYSLSHGARDQYRQTTTVSTAERQAGDLVFFSGPGSNQIEHVGIYLGGGQFIHASSSNGVTIDSLYSNSYYAAYYYGASRVIAG